MLTPQRRALFAAAYSALLLRARRDEPEPAPAPSSSGEQANTQNDNGLPAGWAAGSTQSPPRRPPPSGT